MRRIIMLGWVWLMVLTGCGTDGLTVTIRYDHINDLTKGSRVVFEGTPVGEVQDIVYSEEGFFDITAVFPAEHAASVTEHSRFFITDDPALEGQKAIEMIHLQEGGQPLESGAQVVGTTRTSAFFDQMRERFEKGVGRFSEKMEELSGKIMKETESPEFKELKREFEQLMDEMKRSGEAVRENIEKELIPRLKEELEALKKELEALRKDEKEDAPEHSGEQTETI